MIPGSATPLLLAKSTDGDYKIERSLRFDRPASSYLNRTFSSAGNRKTFTVSFWTKRTSIGDQNIFNTSSTPGQTNASSPRTEFRFSGNGTLKFAVNSSGSAWKVLDTTAVFRDFSAWYHIVVSVDTTQGTAANRVKLYANGVQQTLSGTYPDLNEDLPYNNNYTHTIGNYANNYNDYFDGYLADFYFIDGQALAPSDFGEYDSNNVWQPKDASGLTFGTNGFRLDFSDNSSNNSLGYDATATTPTLNPRGGMDVITYTGNASARTIGGLAFQPDLVWLKRRDGAGNHNIQDSVRGASAVIQSDYNGAEFTNGPRISSFNPDGFSLTSDNGGNTSGATYVAWCWKAGGVTVSNGDGSIDSQVSVSTDYGFSVVTYTSPNNTSDQSFGHGLGSKPDFVIVKNRDATYNWDIYHSSLGYDSSLIFTTATTRSGAFSAEPDTSVVNTKNNYTHAGTNKYVAYCWTEVSGFSKFGSYTGTGATGHKITTGFKPGWILFKRTDAVSNWRIVDRERGVSSLNAETNEAEQTLNFAIEDDGFTINETGNNPNASGGNYIYACFADRPGNNFNTNNLIAAAGLETANQGMDVVTYTGTGSSQTISGLNFQPDLIWCKTRSHAVDHKVVDSVRGLTNVLEANQDRVESTGISNGITALNSDGFTVGSSGDFNTSGRTYVAWCWKAGGTATSNTDGSITSSVSANTTYGFSIANYQGTGANATVGHGLGKPPGFIIIKNRDTERGDAWRVWHKSLAADERMVLSGTNTVGSAPTQWQNTLPSSSVFYLDNDNRYNSTGDDHIAYCWAEIPGFSKFGSYSGSSSTVTVTTGFKPTYILIKCTDVTGQEWIIKTSDLGGGNYLQAQSSAVETSGRDLTFNVDGFSLTGGQGPTNYSGRNYIYAAFADKPPGEIIDSLIDTPTDYETGSGNNGGNYATLNPLQAGSQCTLSNGNLDLAWSGTTGHAAGSTIAVSSGKWYVEFTVGAKRGMIGIIPSTYASKLNIWPGNSAYGSDSYGYYGIGGNLYNNSSNSAYGAGWTTDDVIGVALDLDAGNLVFYKNGSSQGTAATGLSGSYIFAIGFSDTGSGGDPGSFNFGQRPFEYTPPTGFKSLCTTNLPDPTIADSSTAFDAKLYTGNGSSQSITGLGFSPDFVWIKDRSIAWSHQLFDTIRGIYNVLNTDSTSAESTNTEYLTAFNSDGFTVGSNSVVNNGANPDAYVAWTWDAGSSNTTVAVDANGSGLPGAACEYRANPSTGFSIIKVANPTSTQARVHGLNKKPDLIICKSTGSADSWHTYHSSLGYTKYINLNGTGGATSSDQFGSQEPTSTYFYVKANTGSGANKSGGMIYYIWTAVEGYSSFGSYTGNGSADGPFVYTGFRPAFIVCKKSSGSSPWNMFDSARAPYNVVDEGLLADSSNAEFTGADRVDLLSNGFKLKAASGGEPNVSGQTYIYMAFAERPFKTARAR